MKNTSELEPNPLPVLSDDRPQTLGIAYLIEGLADGLIEAGPVVRQWEERLAHQHQQQSQSLQRIEAATMRCQEQLLRVNERMANAEKFLGGMAQEVSKCVGAMGPLGQRLEVLEFNVEQARRLMESIAEKQQQLVDDFIERRVTDHLYRQFLDVHFALRRYSNNGNPNLRADIQATAEAIETFLTESGLRIINPNPGAEFDPREHQPVKVVQSLNAQVSGTISETFVPGLSRSHRVIQQARVAVFKAEGMKQHS